MTVALDIFMEGRIQGVGFRPFVLLTARSLSVCGWVCNNPQGVHVHAEGDSTVLNKFIHTITHKLSSPAQIHSLCQSPSAVQGCTDFTIRSSAEQGEHLGAIMPDLCLCEDCRHELLDPNNRRFQHPFISCTHCGPRFSIIQHLPYDRPQTSMGKFSLCPQCLIEYENPLDRRFHAQPICCPDCGPHMWCEIPAIESNSWHQQKGDWLAQWVSHTQQGKISLVKGIGGFHLLCDAFNGEALQSLRASKLRDRKPFALMVPNLAVAKSFCNVSPAEEMLLQSVERPIVILAVHTPLATMPWLAPGLAQLGVMLPYAPVHELLFSRFKNPVVLTSANRSSEPMLTTNAEARSQGGAWCDMLLLHDREIVNRGDDGVVAVIPSSGQSISLRIGRGGSPREFTWQKVRPMLAFGADLKNAIALAHHGRVTLSQHIGDMEHPLSQDLALQISARLCASYRVEPELIICDEHPDYFSARLAHEYALRKNIPVQRVQHHHAHIAATWLEHQWDGPALGFVMDGTGYGDADCIWGSEVMLYRGRTCESLAHLQGMRLPGGDRAVREPARILLAALHDFVPASLREAWFAKHVEHTNLYAQGLAAMLAANLHCPTTRGLGRLFDLVGAMLAWQNPSWDGEMGSRLENLDVEVNAKPWRIEMQCNQVLLAPLVEDALRDVLQGVSEPMISSRLHATVCELIVQLGLHAERTVAEKLPWAFAGGVFQNRRILTRLQEHAQIRTRNSYFSSIPNDNGIALGQIVVATLS